MLVILAAAAAAAAPPSAEPPLPPTAAGVEVVARRPVVGDLQQGVQAYRSEFFTEVRPGTAFDMIQWLPGFTFEDVRDLRGLAGAAGNVLIDGQPPTSKNDTLATVLRRIPAAQVERVDVIVGGAPGIDMRGRSVIANVVLKKTGAPHGSITASTQIYKGGRLAPEIQATTSRKSGDRSFEASATLARRRLQGTGPGTGTLVRRDPSGAILFEADSRIAGVALFGSGSGAYEFPWAGGKLRINASAIYQDVDADERAQDRGAPALYSIVVGDRFRQGELGLRYQRDFGRTSLETQALQRLNGHRQEGDTLRPPVQTRLEESDALSESVLRSTLRFRRDDRWLFEASAEGAYNRLDTESTFFNGGVLTPLPAEDVLVSERRGELGLLATWKPGKTFNATAALKLETSHLEAAGDLSLQRDLTYLKPRLLLAWSPDDRTQIRLRGEHEVSQIRFQDFAAAFDAGTGIVRAGNPDLKPRRAWVAEATLERQFWTGASVVLTLRRSALRDVVDWRALPDFGNAIAVGNIGDGHSTEAVATVTLPLKRLGLDGVNLKGAVTLRESEVTDPTTGQKRRLSGTGAMNADVHFSHDIPRWKLTWGLDATYFGAGSEFRPTSIQRVGANLRVSAFAEYRLRGDLNLRAEVFNLNDERTPWVVETFGGPRSQAPLRYVEIRRLGDGPYLFLRVRKTVN